MRLVPFPEPDSTSTALVGHWETLPEELPHFLLPLVTAQVQVALPHLPATELLPTSAHLLHLLHRPRQEGRQKADLALCDPQYSELLRAVN